MESTITDDNDYTMIVFPSNILSRIFPPLSFAGCAEKGDNDYIFKYFVQIFY